MAGFLQLTSRQSTPEPMPSQSLPLNDNGVRVVVVGAVFIALTTVTTALRFYARWLKKVSYGWEDWLLLASTVSSPRPMGDDRSDDFSDHLLRIYGPRYAGRMHRRHRISCQRAGAFTAATGSPGISDWPRASSRLLTSKSDTARTTDFVCRRAGSDQVQHLLVAHTNILRQQNADDRISGHGIQCRLGSHDHPARVPSVSSIELQLEPEANCRTLR